MERLMAIQIGDKVKIINPVFFKRCGYPLSLEKAVNYVRENYENEIIELIQKINNTPPSYCKGLYPNLNSYNKNNIIKEFALSYMKSQNFGGNKRSIENYFLPECRDKIFTVIDKKVVKTGILIRDGESQPYLTSQKNHTILKLNQYMLVPMIEFSSSCRGVSMQQHLRIESINVEVIK